MVASNVPAITILIEDRGGDRIQQRTGKIIVFPEFGFSPFTFGDIDDNALVMGNPAFRITLDNRAIIDPADIPVPGQDPVFLLLPVKLRSQHHLFHLVQAYQLRPV